MYEVDSKLNGVFRTLGIIAILCSILVFITQEEIALTFAYQKPFVVYTPFWFANSSENDRRLDLSVVKQDLDLAESLGFQGVKLFCIEGIEWDLDGTEAVFDYCTDLGLKVLLPFRVWRQDEFPENVTSINEFKAFLGDVIPKVKNKTSLLAYVLHYPVNYSDISGYAAEWFGSSAYKGRLQEILACIRALDESHPIWMALEFDPCLEAPYDLGYVDAFGVEPYPWYTPNRFDCYKVQEYLAYFDSARLQVFIDEYGLHTNKSVTHGYVYDETVKAQVVRAFIMKVYDKGYTWPISRCMTLLKRIGAWPLITGRLRSLAWLSRTS